MSSSFYKSILNQGEYDNAISQLREQRDSGDLLFATIYLTNARVNVAELFQSLPSRFTVSFVRECEFYGERAIIHGAIEDANQRTVRIYKYHYDVESKSIVPLLERLPESDDYDISFPDDTVNGITRVGNCLRYVPRSCRLYIEIMHAAFYINMLDGVKASVVTIYATNIIFSEAPVQFDRNLKQIIISRDFDLSNELFAFVRQLICRDTLLIRICNLWRSDDASFTNLVNAYSESSPNLIIDYDGPPIPRKKLKEITMKKRVLTLYASNPTSSVAEFLNADGDHAIMTRVVKMLIESLPRPRFRLPRLPSLPLAPPRATETRRASSYHRARFLG